MLVTALQYSLIIIFINACMQQGMIFGKLRMWLDGWLPEVIQKPLYDCIICMSGIYTVGIWLFINLPELSFTEILQNWYPKLKAIMLLIAMVGGINTVLSPFVELTIFELMRKLKPHG